MMSKSKKVFNTDSKSTTGHMDQLGMLCDAMGGHGDGVIERQEAQGQSSFINSTQLPIKGSGDPAFEKMGIVFGEPTDDLFLEATLPDGWNKERTDHSMWSKLIDDKGRERAMIFYKAAFYDRSAHMNPNRFIVLTGHYDSVTECVCRVEAGGEVVYKTDPVKLGDPQYKDYEIRDAVVKRAERWADEHYPERNDVAAYWDDERKE